METIAVMTELKRITVGEYVSDYENMIENNDKDEIILKEYTEEEVLKHNFKNSINLDKNRKKAFLVGLSTRIDTNRYSEGIYLVSIEDEIIGLRRNKRWGNKKKVCSK